MDVRIYFASPLFNGAERELNRQYRDKLESVATVFLPQEDGALLTDLIEAGVEPAAARRRVFDFDIEAIERCDLVVANLDGRTIDEGVAFELGYAYRAKKTCWGIKTDVRHLLASGDNPMITEAIDQMFSDIENVVEAIRERVKTGFYST